MNEEQIRKDTVEQYIKGRILFLKRRLTLRNSDTEFYMDKGALLELESVYRVLKKQEVL